MQLRVEQCLAAPVERVEAALLDPAWYAAVTASAAAWAPELVEVVGDGPLIGLRVRYRFRGRLNGPAARVLDPARLSWVEVSTLDRDRHILTLTVVPDDAGFGDKLAVTAIVTLSAQGDRGVHTRRVVEGEVKVKVPLVGSKVERAVVRGLQEHAEVEAQIFVRFVAQDR